MDPQGRARGRARGRPPLPGSQESSSPASSPALPPAAPIPRGRGRGLQQVAKPGPLPSAASSEAVKPDLKADLTRPPSRMGHDILRTRPENMIDKRGNSGASIGLLSNFFGLNSKPDFPIFQYMVTFNPEIDRIGQRRFLLRAHDKLLKGYLFDGGAALFSPNYHERTLELASEGVLIDIKFVKELNYLDGNYLQVLNIISRKCLRLMGLTQVGRGYYDPAASILLKEFNLELWPGYATSIRQHDSSTLMASEVTFRVLRNESVLHSIEQMYNQHGPNFEHPVKGAILGVMVLTDYNNRHYRVDDIDFKKTPLSQFSMKDGRTVTFVQYYLDRYEIKITNLSQPLLVSRTKPKMSSGAEAEYVYLVPELCRLTGLTEEMKSNFQLMKAIAEYTRVVPQKRISSLTNFARRLLDKPEIVEELKTWDMKFNPNLAQVEGRVMPMESIVQGMSENEIRYDAGQNVDWTMKLRANEMLLKGPLQRWVAIIPYNVGREARQFIGQILQSARGMHLDMCDPYVHEIRDDNLSTYVNAIDEILSRQTPDILVCMVSNNRSDRYAAIKKKCCVERSVPTQVITKRSMTNKNSLSIATKISIQMNCKVGGAPWACVNPLKGVMVCGYDASHDTMRRGCSYGGFVASLNNTLSRYFSTVFAHPNGCDISNHLSAAVEKALNKFLRHNDGSLPSRIIFYRDGVGDGQIPTVLNNEVEAIKEILTRHYRGPNFKFTFVIVSKRINARFFTQNQQNPPPGTVVDSGVTLPERYDFFIVSQSVRQGTVSPTSYNVIFDNSGLDPDKMQRFTYKMTHLYYNWSGTIKVPAPVQYAHKLAMLVGQFLHKEPQHELDELLYFL